MNVILQQLQRFRSANQATVRFYQQREEAARLRKLQRRNQEHRAAPAPPPRLEGTGQTTLNAAGFRKHPSPRQGGGPPRVGGSFFGRRQAPGGGSDFSQAPGGGSDFRPAPLPPVRPGLDQSGRFLPAKHSRP